MSEKKASPVTNKEYVAMMNDVVLNLWKPAQKEGMLNKEEFAEILATVDSMIEKYKKYTYPLVIKDNNGNELRTEERAYIEDFVLSTLEMILANEGEKLDEQNKILKLLEGI